MGFEWTNDHCTVTVIEVKSVEATPSEYRIEKGVVSGAAINQMLATRRLLAATLANQRDDELITTPARREILREHGYRELTKDAYSPGERKLWANRLGRLLILDEAWRVVASPFLTPLMREGRAFGLGVVVASQFPRDLPEAVRGSTATRLFFSQGQVEQIREIQRTIVGKTSGPEAEHVVGVVRSLTPLSCVMHSTQYTPFVRVTITPYFRRRGTAESM